MHRSTASASISKLQQDSHSTSTAPNDVQHLFCQTALNAWKNGVEVDILDNHRWLESIFQSLADAQTARHKGKEEPFSDGSRVVFTELMKTPGRKRVAANLSTTTNLSKKDPVATLLFPAPSLSFARPSPANTFIDKENASVQGNSPSRIPASPSRAGKGRTVGPSPIRSDSPRTGPLSKRLLGSAKTATPAPTTEKKNAPSPLKSVGVQAGDVFFDDSLVLALVDAFDEAEGDGEEPAEQDEVVVEEEKANLSIIGEEEEEEEATRRSLSGRTRDSDANTNTGTLLTAPLAPTPFSTLPDTQTTVSERTNVSPPTSSVPLPTPAPSSKSPVRSSTSSSVLGALPDADEDLSEAPPVPSKDISLVPLNDNPSTLRNQPLLLSTSSAPTHTPGGSTSMSSTTPRFGTSAYSSGKAPTTGGAGHGAGILSSSPPAASSTLYGRASTGPRPQLSFVGLPKKSLGHGLGIGGLGRSLSGASWNPATGGESQGSQGSTAASISSVFGSQPQPNASNSVPLVGGTGAASGGIKRKSITGPEESNKAARVDVYNPEDAASKARREALSSRLMGMGSRPSNVARASNVARPSAFGSFAPKALLPATGTSTSTSAAPVPPPPSTVATAAIPTPAPTPVEPSFPVVATASIATARIPTPPLNIAPIPSATQNSPPKESASAPTPVSSFAPVATAAPAASATRIATGLVRRSSVSDLVKVYERNSLRPLSPPLARPSSRLASPYSPAPGSPRRQQPSTSNRPTSPAPASASAQRMALRSPPRNTATATSIPWLAGGRSPVSIAQVQVQAQAQMAFKPTRSVATAPLVISEIPPSTTPKGSPVAAATARSILKQLAAASAEAEKMDEEIDEVEQEEDEDEEEEEAMVIREVLQGPSSHFVSVPPSSPPMSIQSHAEKREQEAESRLASLPARLDLIQDEEFADDEGDDGEEKEEKENVVVEEGRGALVHALEEAREEEMKRGVMPGAFGGGEEEEEVVVQQSRQITTSVAKKSSVASFASSSQSQAQSPSSSVLSFFGKPFGGATTTKKPEQVKSIQLARANKKKEEQEKERRAALKEERDQKRSALMQKKQDEDRQKQDDERKVKNDGADRKRKERDELASSQPASSTNPTGMSGAAKPKVVSKVKSKPEDEPGKKRKLGDQTTEPKRPAETKKPVAGPSRPATASSNLNSSTGNKNGPLASSNGHLKSSTSAMVGVKYMNDQVRTGGNTFASGLPARVATLNPSAPKPFGNQSQHQGGAFASGSGQNRAPPPPPQPRVEEPYQELPDIDSEYSDSADEDHEEKVKALPQWAQSPALKGALDSQQYVNPDNIFGTVPPLSMQEIFRTNSSRITKRTSSACWEGPDALSQADMAKYDRQMGFSRTRPSRFSKE